MKKHVTCHIVIRRSKDTVWALLRDYQIFKRESLDPDFSPQSRSVLQQQTIIEWHGQEGFKARLENGINTVLLPSTLDYQIKAEGVHTHLNLTLSYIPRKLWYFSPADFLVTRCKSKIGLSHLASDIKKYCENSTAIKDQEGIVAQDLTPSKAKPYPLRIPNITRKLSLYVHDTASDIHISEQIKAAGIWEAFETDVMRQRIKPGDIFVDVGANIGYYTVVAATLVGSFGKVFAFEPDPTNFALLAKNSNINRLSNAWLINAAMTDSDADGKLFLNPENCGDHQIFDADGKRAAIPIRMLNGSNFLSSHVRHINFIKIDTQGAEVGVLMGLAPIIKSSLPNLKMIIEFWPFGLRKAGHKGDELLDLILGFDFVSYSIIDHEQNNLIPTNRAELMKWIRLSESDPNCEGFINLLCEGA